MNDHAKRYRRLWDGGYPYPPEWYTDTCSARTRKGTPCKMRSVWANGRCKLHGGLSTGPKTEEGRRQSAINGRKGGRPRKNNTGRHIVEVAAPAEHLVPIEVAAPAEAAMPTPSTSVRLDWDRPYGTVYGDASKYRYEQDGRRFDHSGLEVDEYDNRR